MESLEVGVEGEEEKWLRKDRGFGGGRVDDVGMGKIGSEGVL